MKISVSMKTIVGSIAIITSKIILCTKEKQMITIMTNLLPLAAAAPTAADEETGGGEGGAA